MLEGPAQQMAFQESFKDSGVFHFVIQYSRISETCPQERYRKKKRICREQLSRISSIRTVMDTSNRAGRWDSSQRDTREEGA